MDKRKFEDMFTMHGMDIDLAWYLEFKEKAHARDARPLVMEGRIITASGQKGVRFPASLQSQLPIQSQRGLTS